MAASRFKILKILLVLLVAHLTKGQQRQPPQLANPQEPNRQSPGPTRYPPVSLYGLTGTAATIKPAATAQSNPLRSTTITSTLKPIGTSQAANSVPPRPVPTTTSTTTPDSEDEPEDETTAASVSTTEKKLGQATVPTVAPDSLPEKSGARNTTSAATTTTATTSKTSAQTQPQNSTMAEPGTTSNTSAEDWLAAETKATTDVDGDTTDMPETTIPATSCGLSSIAVLQQEAPSETYDSSSGNNPAVKLFVYDPCTKSAGPAMARFTGQVVPAGRQKNGRFCFVVKDTKTLECLESNQQIRTLAWRVPSRLHNLVMVENTGSNNDWNVYWTPENTSCLRQTKFGGTLNVTHTIGCGDWNPSKLTMDSIKSIALTEQRNSSKLLGVNLPSRTSFDYNYSFRTKPVEAPANGSKLGVGLRTYYIVYLNPPAGTESGKKLSKNFLNQDFMRVSIENGRLFWTERDKLSGNSSIRSVTIGDKGSTEVMFSSPGNVLSFGSLAEAKPPKRTSCTQQRGQKCSHFCQPLSEVNYRCWCPDELPILQKGNCTGFTLLAATKRTDSAPGDDQDLTLRILSPQTGVYEASNRSLLWSKTSEPSPAFSFNFDANRLCWVEDKKLKCSKNNEKAMEVPGSNDASLPVPYNGILTHEVYWLSNFADGGGDLNLWSDNLNSALRLGPKKVPPPPKMVIDGLRKTVFWCGTDVNTGRSTLNWMMLDGTGTNSLILLKDADDQCREVLVNEVTQTLYVISSKFLHRVMYADFDLLLQVVASTDVVYKFARDSPAPKGAVSLDYYLIWIRGDTSIEVFDTKSDPKPTKAYTLDAGEKLYQIALDQHWPATFYNPCDGHSCAHYCFPKDRFPHYFSKQYKCLSPADRSAANWTSAPFVYVAPQSDTKLIIIYVSIAFVALLILIAVVNAAIWMRLRRQYKMALARAVREFLEGNPERLAVAKDEAAKAQYRPFSAILDPKALKVDTRKVLGEGNFGVVWEGTCDGKPAAVKSVKNNLDPALLQEFLRELKVMTYVGEHPYIVEFWGAEVSQLKQGKVYVILELSPYGSLLNYIRDFAKKASSEGVDYTQVLADYSATDPQIQALGRKAYAEIQGFTYIPKGLPEQASSSSAYANFEAPEAAERNIVSTNDYANAPVVASTSDADYANSPSSIREVPIPESYKQVAKAAAEKAIEMHHQHDYANAPYASARNLETAATGLYVNTEDKNEEQQQNTALYVNANPEDRIEVAAEPATETTKPKVVVKPLPVLRFAWQISQAMEYLNKKRVVHGDLAARNVLVFDGDIVKVSDFGFARNLYQSSTYRKKHSCALPWRWSAPETLERMEFSCKSDVWSYGVTLWELFTLGNMPFAYESYSDDFVDGLKRGGRLSKPDWLAQRVYDEVMLRCWIIDPENRPSFEQLNRFWREYFGRV